MEIRQTSQFKKDIKKLKSSKKGKKTTSVLKKAIFPRLLSKTPLPAEHRDHALIGDWIPARECHVFPDTLLIYRVEDDVLVLVRVGSHGELFG